VKALAIFLPLYMDFENENVEYTNIGDVNSDVLWFCNAERKQIRHGIDLHYQVTHLYNNFMETAVSFDDPAF